MSDKNEAARHLATGQYGEKLAENLLREKGLSILERNWRPAPGLARGAASLELDIIARDGDCLVFVEVKTRHLAPGRVFNPLELFGQAKQKRLLRAAAFYLKTRVAWASPCRFDLICVIIGPDGTTSMEHYENVLCIEHSGRAALGGGNAPWQPW